MGGGVEGVEAKGGHYYVPLQIFVILYCGLCSTLLSDDNSVDADFILKMLYYCIII